MKRAILFLAVAACTDAAEPTPSQTAVEQDTTVCGVGPTVKGIDISYYQGTINWTAVKGAGVVYAQIRTSDGSFHDPNFDSYWAGSRAAGIKHGAYHFLRPEQDPIVQADYMLSKIGNKIEADDLPPMIDVEASDNVSPAGVAAAVKKFSDHVEAKLGRKPIIYVGKYFWEGNVGNPDMHMNPLWHAQYTSASCPDIASTWPTWTFWQYTSTGSIAGISGSVDVDRFNGDATAFTKFLGPGGPCGTVDAAGAMIDNDSACYTAGGPATGIRHVTNAGMTNDLDWTHTTSLSYEQNYAQWDLYFAEAGNYEIQVYTAKAYAQSKQAKYAVVASGQTASKTIDQTAVDGWQSLGTFAFAKGGAQSVHLGDNTGEPEANNVQLVFDAVQVIRDDGTGSGSGSGSGTGSDGSGAGDPPVDPAHAGCTAGGGGAGGAVVLALGVVLGLRRDRRRRRA